MKKCSRCSAENFEDQKFCNLCGRELTARIALDLYAGTPASAKPPQAEEQLTPEARAYAHFVRAKDEIAARNLDGAILEFKAALAACPGDPMIERLLKKTEDARERATGSPLRSPDARPAAEAQRPKGPRTLGGVPHASAQVGASAHGAASQLSSASPLAAGNHAPAYEARTPRPGRSLVEDPASPVALPPRPRPTSSVPVMGDISASAGIEADDAPVHRRIGPVPGQNQTRAGALGAHAAGPAHAGGQPPAPRAGSHMNAHTGHAAANSRRTPVPAGASIPTAARVTRGGRPEVHAAAAPRGFRGTAADEGGQRVAPHTGRFLELYERAPSLSPALALDGRSDEGVREIAVNLLILGGFLIFGFLLLL